MIGKRRLGILAVIVLLWAASAPSAQTGYRPANEFGEARFSIDAATFRSEKEDLNTLEIYYKIFYDALSFRKTDAGYTAEYEIALIVEGDNGDQIEATIKEGSVEVQRFADTRKSTDFIINLVTVPHEPQDLTVKAILTDKISESTRELKKDLKKRKYWEKYPTLSYLQFSREVSAAATESKFNKADARVIPSVTRLFGGDFDSILTYYMEVYPGESSVKYIKVITGLYNRTKGFVYSDTVDYGEIVEIEREVHNINVAGLRPGDYELEARLEGRRGKVYDKLVQEFELELTGETMFRNDPETAIEMLKYLATRDELKALKKAAGDDERRRLWDEFWDLRAAGRRDRENPTKAEYFRRIRHSNRYFSFMRKEGWKTTRGMIYVTYGEPDEVDDYPFELATKPYQVWKYYRLSPQRRFLFIDEWGDGNYELQPPYNGLDW